MASGASTAMIREAVVAGTFYAGTRQALEEQLNSCFLSPLGPGRLPDENPHSIARVSGVVSPHAGYMYSGPVAAWAFLRLSHAHVPSTVVLLGPNHRGVGFPVATMTKGSWQTPLGNVDIDVNFARLLVSEAGDLLRDDGRAHAGEHSLEVQIPFLQFVFGQGFQIVPISLADQRASTCMRLGKVLAQCARGREDILFLASTDLSHYHSEEIAQREDQRFIKAVLTGEAENISMLASSPGFSVCGYGTVIAVLEATACLASRQIKLLKYATSAAVTGQTDAVVGYAALSVEPE